MPPVRVFGNVSMVEGILTNLIDNALRYGRSPEGQVSRVTVQLTPHVQGVMLSIIENGAGLGLAIVAKFAQVMGARFELGSPQTGQGLRAAVIFQI
jgi:two-component system sensor histidine kinase TctE